MTSQEKEVTTQQNKIDGNADYNEGEINNKKASILALKSTISGFFQPPPYPTEYTQSVVSVLTDVISYVPAGSCGILAAVSYFINFNWI